MERIKHDALLQNPRQLKVNEYVYVRLCVCVCLHVVCRPKNCPKMMMMYGETHFNNLLS